MLSDGYLGFSHCSQNAHLHFMQSLRNSNYLWFVFAFLAHYCTSCPYYYTRKRAGVFSYGVAFFTRALPCLTEIYPLFYENNIKIVPKNIYELLTPIALAHMIMGDGPAKPYGLELCTDSYSLQDTLRILNVWIIRYQLNCTLRTKRPGQYRLYISSKSMPILRSIVSPYFHTSMLYKLGK
jgi:hypothetical protein